MYPVKLVAELKAIAAELFEMMDRSSYTLDRYKKLKKRFAAVVDEPLPPSVAVLGVF